MTKKSGVMKSQKLVKWMESVSRRNPRARYDSAR